MSAANRLRTVLFSAAVLVMLAGSCAMAQQQAIGISPHVQNISTEYATIHWITISGQVSAAQ